MRASMMQSFSSFFLLKDFLIIICSTYTTFQIKIQSILSENQLPLAYLSMKPPRSLECVDFDFTREEKFSLKVNTSFFPFLPHYLCTKITIATKSIDILKKSSCLEISFYTKLAFLLLKIAFFSSLHRIPIFLRSYGIENRLNPMLIE